MIKENLEAIRATLPSRVVLVAVSKYHPAEMLQEAYDAGQRIFGESRENELRQKDAVLPHDIEWHFIGHLQTNKVKYIMPMVSLIHSVDSERLLDEIQRQAVRFAPQRQERFGTDKVDILLQLHVAQEESKSGFTPDELLCLLCQTEISQRWPNLRLCGVMGMASFVDDPQQWRQEFQAIKACRMALLDGPLKTQGIDGTQFAILSFGMSTDYQVAIEEGANMVRIGTSIFGPRVY